MTPFVTVFESENGDPIASTHSPGRASEESANFNTGRFFWNNQNKIILKTINNVLQYSIDFQNGQIQNSVDVEQLGNVLFTIVKLHLINAQLFFSAKRISALRRSCLLRFYELQYLVMTGHQSSKFTTNLRIGCNPSIYPNFLQTTIFGQGQNWQMR